MTQPSIALQIGGASIDWRQLFNGFGTCCIFVTRPLPATPGCRLSTAHFSHLRLIVEHCTKSTRPPTNDFHLWRPRLRIISRPSSAHAPDVPEDHEQSVWAVSPEIAPFSSVPSPYAPHASHIPSDHEHSVLHVSPSRSLPIRLGPSFRSKVRTLQVVWFLFMMIPSPPQLITHGGSATSAFGCVALLDARSPQSFVTAST